MSNKIARALGAAIAITIVGCIAACICGSLVAVTVKFIGWMF